MAKRDGNEQTKFNQFLNKFEAFLKDVSLKPWRGKSYVGNVHMMRTYGHNNAQLQWGSKSILEATQTLKEIFPLISDKTAKRLVRELMVSLFENQFISEDADPKQDADIDSLYDELDRSNLRQKLEAFVRKVQDKVKPYRLLVPLHGIEFNSRGKTKIGMVDLYHPDDPTILDTIAKLKKRLGTNEDSIDEDLKDIKCFALVDITGEEDHVRHEARRLANDAIDILNLYLSSSLHQPNWDAIRLGNITIGMSLDSEENAPGFQQFFPVKWKFDLDVEKLDNFMNHGLEILNERMIHKSSNKITQRLKRAITWYSKAVNADSHEERFVNLSIALESLLIDKSEENNTSTTGSINQKLRERIAFLLGTNKEQRVELARLTGQLYGHRSGIVHSGEPVGPGELREMDNIVKYAIVAFLKKDFDSWKDFLNWIEQQRFTIPSDGNQVKEQ